MTAEICAKNKHAAAQAWLVKPTPIYMKSAATPVSSLDIAKTCDRELAVNQLHQKNGVILRAAVQTNVRPQNSIKQHITAVS